MRHGRITRFLLASSLAASALAAESLSADWPQFRGPTRDGVAPPGPKLLDAWPTNGPKVLWKSAPIGSGNKGGCGSVTIAEGKVFVFAHTKAQKKIVITAKELNDLGWDENMPDDLGLALDKAYDASKGAWRRLKPGPAWDAVVKEVQAALDPKMVEKCGPFIEKRMNQMRRGRNVYNDGDDVPWIKWQNLAKLAKLRDQEFPTMEALDREMERTGCGGGLNNWHGGPFMEAARPLFYERFFDYHDTVVCLDASTGRDLWRRSFPGRLTRLTEDIGASSTPAVADGKVYVAGSAGFYCLATSDGAAVWQAKTGFSSSSPLAAHGAVYVCVPALTAYEAKTGRVLWTCDKIMNENASVALWRSGGKDYLLAHNACIDPTGGAVIWTTREWGASMPVFVDADTMVAVHGTYDVMKFRITPEKAEKLWETNCGAAPRGSSPVVWQDSVYNAGGAHSYEPVQCYDLKTGRKNWQPKKFGHVECASPIAADGKIFVNADDFVMFKATAERYEELGRFKPRGAVCTSPAIAGGKLFLRLEDGVACYDLTAK